MLRNTREEHDAQPATGPDAYASKHSQPSKAVPNPFHPKHGLPQSKDSRCSECSVYLRSTDVPDPKCNWGGFAIPTTILLHRCHRHHGFPSRRPTIDTVEQCVAVRIGQGASEHIISSTPSTIPSRAAYSTKETCQLLANSSTACWTPSPGTSYLTAPADRSLAPKKDDPKIYQLLTEPRHGMKAIAHREKYRAPRPKAALS